MTRNKVSESITGLMEEDTKENGFKENNMAMENTTSKIILWEKEFGRMEKELNGLMKKNENYKFINYTYSIDYQMNRI